MNNGFARYLPVFGFAMICVGMRWIGRRFTLGAVSLLIGIALIAVGAYFYKRADDSNKRLMLEGQCVDADFDWAKEAVFYTKHSRPMYKASEYTIQCSYRDPSNGLVYSFTSAPIRLHFDPSFELRSRKTLKVYIDRNDPSKYYVDLSCLEEIEKRHR